MNKVSNHNKKVAEAIGWFAALTREDRAELAARETMLTLKDLLAVAKKLGHREDPKESGENYRLTKWQPFPGCPCLDGKCPSCLEIKARLESERAERERMDSEDYLKDKEGDCESLSFLKALARGD
jgi:hypothetical protein